MKVKKRDGVYQDYTPDKIYEMVKFCCEGLDASPSDIIMAAKLKIVDGITTKMIHQIIIQACVELITEDEPDYSLAAGRLAMVELHKEIFGGLDKFPHLSDLIKQNVQIKLYTHELLDNYTEDELEFLNSKLVHDADFDYHYAAVTLWQSKYLVKNRATGVIVETPQYANMIIAMVGFIAYPKSERLDYVVRMYNALKDSLVSLPTPIMSGLRTPLKQFSSCVLLSVGDSLDSICAASNNIVKYSSQRAGLGVDISRIRAVNSPIKNGLAKTTGLFGFIRMLVNSMKSCSQGGVRDASSTIFLPAFHKEIESFMVLKNNEGNETNRIRNSDYAVVWNDYLLNRCLNQQDVSLFCPNDVPEVFELYYSSNIEGFARAYEEAESNNAIHRQTIKGLDLLLLFIIERQKTNRLYAMFVDEANIHTPFKDSIRQSNLCVTGDQRVVSDRGLLTAQELYEQGGELTLFDNVEPVQASAMQLVEQNVDVFKVTLNNGMTHTITAYHKVKTDSGMKRCDELSIGEKVAFQNKKGLFGSLDMQDEAFLLGLYQADGTQYKDLIHICLWENDFDLIEEVEEKFTRICNKYETQHSATGRIYDIPKFREDYIAFGNSRKKSLISKALKKSLNFEKGYIPQWVWESNEATQWEYVRGLYYADGTVRTGNLGNNPLYLSITNINHDFLLELQLLLANLGINTSLSIAVEAREHLLPDGKGGKKLYQCQTSYRLVTGNKSDGLRFEEHTKFLSRKNVVLEDREYRDNTKKFSRIKSIEYVGKEDVYCCIVDSKSHTWICNGFITSNCLEILQPTVPDSSPQDSDGLISLCTLAAVNVGKIKKQSDFKEPMSLLVRFLDEVLTYQNYPVESARKATDLFRTLGIGIINLAYYLAKHDLYNPNNLSLMRHKMNEMGEAMYYYALEATIELAKEKGKCEGYDRLKYADGKLLIDNYNRNIDELAPYEMQLDWDIIREAQSQYGVRNATLLAMFPAENSAIISNSTNGIEPVRNLVVIKENKGTNSKQVVPEIKKLKKRYKIARTLTNREFIDIQLVNMGILQKYVCQGISTNTYINAKHYPEDNIDVNDLIEQFVTAKNLGLKTIYYGISGDTSAENDLVDGNSSEEDDGCASGACKV